MAPGDLTKETVLERERRWARPVAIATILAVLLYIGSIVVEQSVDLIDREDDAKRLITFHENESGLLGTAIMLAIGASLLSAPLFYLFKAAEGRSDKVRSSLVAFAFIGPVLFGVQAIFSWFALKDVAADFVAGSQQTEQVAEDLIENSGALQAASGIVFPAVLGLLVGVIYISLMAMRQGLITRFFGTLGMALGASLALFPPIALLGLMIWFIYIGLMIGGWLPGGRPPAWAAGIAVPWPKPGDEIQEDAVRGGSIPGPAAPGEAMEGSGREISEPPLPDEGAAGEAAAADDETGPKGETQGQRRKKRKRR